MQTILNNLGAILLVVVAFLGAFLAALWVSLILWTFRDARSRSRDPFAHLLAALMVAVFGPLGMFIYLILRPQETLAEAYERSLEEEALLQDIEVRAASRLSRTTFNSALPVTRASKKSVPAAARCCACAGTSAPTAGPARQHRI